MNLSKRLNAVAGQITIGNTVADIGTDHGYIPIYMTLNDFSPKAYAMDVNEGPLMRASDNIRKYNVEGKVVTRLSDGLKGLAEGEAKSIVIAGMGGLLTIRILSDGIEVAKSADELILSPHSDVHLVREYLADNDYKIINEDMVLEDGKFYFILKVVKGVMELRDDVEKFFGKYLIERKDETMGMYLKKEEAKRLSILDKMSASDNAERVMELQAELELIRKALVCYEG